MNKEIHSSKSFPLGRCSFLITLILICFSCPLLVKAGNSRNNIYEQDQVRFLKKKKISHHREHSMGSQVWAMWPCNLFVFSEPTQACFYTCFSCQMTEGPSLCRVEHQRATGACSREHDIVVLGIFVMILLSGLATTFTYILICHILIFQEP